MHYYIGNLSGGCWYVVIQSFVPTFSVENATVPVSFENDHKVYRLPWSDLLQLNELPFESVV